MSRHKLLSEFINSGNGSPQTGEGKQLSQFINSENPSRTEGGAE